MEAGSLTVGCIGLVNVIIDDIRYIKLAKDFGTTYSTAMVSLGNAEVRLSRWCKAVDLTQNQTDESAKADAIHAEATLNNINKLVKDARRKSVSYETEEHGDNTRKSQVPAGLTMPP